MNEKTPQPAQRLLSLDTLRGFDMLFIMGFAGLVVTFCRLFPGDTSDFFIRMMQHPEWHGFSHHDTIFPLFLFIAGLSYPFSLQKQRSLGASRFDLYRKIVRRGLLLILFGLIYNGLFRFEWPMRTASVLGRIGLAWAFAAILYLNFRTRTRIGIVAAILLGYWALLALVPAPDAPQGADIYSMEGTIVGYVDRLLLPGRLLSKIFDPEGWLSTLPAVATAMLGMLTGEFIRQPDSRFSGNRKALYMALAAVAFTLVGMLWDLSFPINKKLWTSSFVCVVAGYSLGMFALFYWLIDVRGYRSWTLPFQVIGLNSITIYMAQRIVDFRGIATFFFGGIASKTPEAVAPVIISIGYLLVSWLFLYFLYKKKIFLKI